MRIYISLSIPIWKDKYLFDSKIHIALYKYSIVTVHSKSYEEDTLYYIFYLNNILYNLNQRHFFL